MTIDYIKCACGCDTNIEPTDRYKRPHKFVNGHNFTNKMADETANWKGGKQIQFSRERGIKKAYLRVYMPGHPRASKKHMVYNHILVMEKHVGRHLRRDECVVHLNGINTDDRIENLELITRSELCRRMFLRRMWEKGF